MKDLEKFLISAAGAAGLYLLFSSVMGDNKTSLPASRTPTEDKVMRWASLIWTYALMSAVEPAVIASVIHQESGGQPDAQGASGEIGLMQILPSTGQGGCGLGAQELLEPQKNIGCGSAYLREMMDIYNAPAVFPVILSLPLAAYNAGSSRVYYDLYTGWTMPAQSREYMQQVLGRVPRYRQLFQELPQYSAYKEYFPPEDWSITY